MKQLNIMYAGAVNSKATSIVGALDITTTTIEVLDGDTLPNAPNLLVLGGDSTSETVLMTNKVGNTLTVERAVQGMARSWEGGTLIARNFTEKDYATLMENININNDNVNTLNTSKIDKVTGKDLSDNNYTDLEVLEVAKVKDKLDKTIFNTHDADIVKHITDLERNDWNNKVDKELGKSLSTNDYTDLDKTEVGKIKDKADKTELHTHTNKAVLDDLSDVTGKLKYKGLDIGNTEVATTLKDGLMSSADKVNVDKIPILTQKVNLETPLNTTSQNLSGAVNELKTEITIISGKAGKIGTKDVDETDIADNYTLRYDGVKDKIVYVKSEIDREPPSKVTNISVKEDNTKLTVNYTPPLDSDYMGTRLVYNTTANPVNINDGTVIANFVSGTDITGLLNDTKYFIRLFPYDMSGNYNIEAGQSVSATPTEQKIYGITIDESNSNPNTRVTYIENAVGMTPCNGGNSVFAYGSWEDVIKNEWGIKPCLLKNLGLGNAEVNYYLSPEDYKKKADGILASMLNGTDGDVVIEIPLLYYSWTTVGTIHTIKVSNKPFAGAVKYAHEIEKGYNQMNYYPLLLTQILFVLLFKSTDSQTTLGRGYVDGNSAYATTGNTDSKGFMFGESTGKQQNKFLGMEDYWGNKFYWIDGCVSDASYNVLLGKSNFNDTGSGYVSYSSGLSANTAGYIDKVQGGNDKGFIIKGIAGSETTHYCDYGYLASSRVAYFGGSLSSGSYAGFGDLRVHGSVSSAFANVGSRLFYSNGVDKIYIGAYLGTTQTGKLRSVSGTTPSDTKTISVFRTEAKANNN